MMEKAKAQGIPVIAYDRPIAGADYYVSFDNVKVGELQGQMIVDGLEAAGKDPATAIVVYMGGDATDGNAKMFHDGADSVMSAAGIKPAAEPTGVWDGEKTATNFEQALTASRRKGRRGLGRQRHRTLPASSPSSTRTASPSRSPDRTRRSPVCRTSSWASRPERSTSRSVSRPRPLPSWPSRS